MDFSVNSLLNIITKLDNENLIQDPNYGLLLNLYSQASDADIAKIKDSRYIFTNIQLLGKLILDLKHELAIRALLPQYLWHIRNHNSQLNQSQINKLDDLEIAVSSRYNTMKEAFFNFPLEEKVVKTILQDQPNIMDVYNSKYNRNTNNRGGIISYVEELLKLKILMLYFVNDCDVLYQFYLHIADFSVKKIILCFMQEVKYLQVIRLTEENTELNLITVKRLEDLGISS
ncbi:MAG: hypothetical protein OEY49_11235 [Candidatus Heimdallarchaeota archaeon]|nr:hypothetical protein [Candidatus Heimdallarchaeota archaeon]